MLPGSLLPPFLRREPGDEATGGVDQVAVSCSEMAEQQRQDSVESVGGVHEHRVWPSDERLGKKTVVESSQCSMMDGILYFADGGGDSNLRIVVPEAKEADGRDTCWKSHWAFCW